jgi:hypothetical protein
VLVEQPGEGGRAVCCCFFGASRSLRNIASIAALNGSNRGEVRAGVLRCGGIELANACRTVRRCT